MSSPALNDPVPTSTLGSPADLLVAAAEAMLDGLAILSAVRDDQRRIVDFRYEYINPRGAELDRRSRADHLGRNILDLAPTHRATPLFDLCVQVVETGRPLVREILDCDGIDTDGLPLPRVFEAHIARLGDGLSVTWRDITAQKQAEQALQRRLNQLSILNEIAQIIALEADMSAMLRQVGAATERLFEHTRVAIGLLNADGTELRYPGHFQRSRHGVTIPDRHFPLAQHRSLQAVLDLGRTLTFDRAQTQPLLQSASDLLRFTGAEAMMLAPLRARGEAMGIMTLWTDHPGATYTPADISLAETVGGQIAGAVETRRLFEEEARQRRIAESLREIALALIGTLDEAKLLGIIFDQLQRVIAYESAAVMLVEGADLVVTRAAGPHALTIGARLALTSGLPSTRVFQTRSPLVIADITQDKVWSEYLKDTPVRSWMGAPLVVSDQAIGVLTVVSANVSQYSADQGRMLQAFATQAAIAIEHARLYQRAQSMAIDAERQRLARELHDSVAQELYSVTLMTNGLKRLADKGQLEPVKSGLQDLQALSRQALRDTRLLTHQLRPSLLKDLGLVQALQHRLSIVEQRAGVQATFTVAGDLTLSPVVEEHLFQIAQEALNNALRHAQARQVQVSLAATDGAVTLRVSDDGAGFDPAQTPTGLGLGHLAERAAIIGAQLTFQSRPGGGTSVEVRLPGG